MRTSIRILLVVALLAATVGLALADRQIHETRPALPGGTVSVEIIAGSVRIEGWDRDEVEVTGRVGEDVEEVEVDASDDEVSIEVHLRDDLEDIRHGDADLVVRLPVDNEIDVETISADVEIEAVRGEISLESISGTLTVETESRELEIATISGRINVRPRGELRSGEFETVSGTIDFDGDLDDDGRYSFEAVSGNITVRLPKSSSASFDVETFSGKIDNELGPPARRTSEYLPAKTLRFSTGGGDARVTIECFSGLVRILAR